MGTKFGEMRETLMEAIERVKAGTLEPQEAVAIAKLAAQITESMKAEANIRLDGMLGEKLPLGHMAIGHERKAIDG